jgi:biopolymer transport protein ExbD
MNQPNPASQKTKTGFGSQRKKELKIDMTPMVDLGFLLISFFVITTELSEPKAMDLIVPKKGPLMPIKYSTAVTFLPAADNKLYYYFGDWKQAISQNEVFQISYQLNDIGKIITDRKNYLIKNKIEPEQLFVMIKPGNRANYKNVVDLLDEMIILAVSRYALLKQDPAEIDFLDNNE